MVLGFVIECVVFYYFFGICRRGFIVLRKVRMFLDVIINSLGRRGFSLVFVDVEV